METCLGQCSDLLSPQLCFFASLAPLTTQFQPVPRICNDHLTFFLSRQGSYPGMTPLGAMGPGGPGGHAGPGGPYSQQPGSNSGRMTPQGPPYSAPPSGRTADLSTCQRLVGRCGGYEF